MEVNFYYLLCFDYLYFHFPVVEFWKLTYTERQMKKTQFFFFFFRMDESKDKYTETRSFTCPDFTSLHARYLRLSKCTSWWQETGSFRAWVVLNVYVSLVPCLFSFFNVFRIVPIVLEDI